MRSSARLEPAHGAPRLGVLAVVAIALTASANVLANGFVFDDLQNILQNPWVRDPRRVWEAFDHSLVGFDPRFDTSYYRPVMYLVAAACHAVAGLRPWAFHLVNLLTHAAISACVFVLLFRWSVMGLPEQPPDPATEERPAPAWAMLQSGAFLAAALFAVHPVHAEAVAWNAGIVDISYSFFFLAALLVGTRDGSRRPLVRGAVVAVLAWFALLSKEPAVALVPVVATAVLVGRLGGVGWQWRDLAIRLAPVAVALLAYLSLRVRALGGLMRGGGERVRVGAVDGFATALSLVAEYSKMLLAPVHLSAVHDLGVVATPFAPRALLGLAACGLLAWGLWRGRRFPGITLGGALLVLPLLPALYVPVLGEGLAAERYLYLPSAGAALMLATAIELAARRGWSRRVATAGAAAVIVVFGAGTLRRNTVWRDDVSLWTDAVEKVPSSAVAHEYLGHAQLTAGQTAPAARELARALELDPTRRDARVNLGSALAVLGRTQEAIAQETAVLAERADVAEAHAVIGYALAVEGRFEAAIEAYERALRINPSMPAVQNSLGLAYARLGRIDAALVHLGAAVRLAPDHAGYVRDLRRFSR